MTLRTGSPRRHRALALAGGVVLLLGSIVGLAAPAQASADSSTLVSLTNAERSERGLPKYQTSGELASVAQTWAQKMARSGDLEHNPRLASQVSGYDYVGENVGYGANAAQIHGALMNSAPHKANILDRDFTQIGVGAARDSKGTLWIAEVFRDPSGSSSPKPSAKPKPKSTPKPSAKPSPRPSAPSVRTSSTSGNSTAPKRVVRPAKPAPKKVVTPAAPAAPTYAEKMQQVQTWANAASSGDPLVTTMAFARAMDTLAS